MEKNNKEPKRSLDTRKAIDRVLQQLTVERARYRVFARDVKGKDTEKWCLGSVTGWGSLVSGAFWLYDTYQKNYIFNFIKRFLKNNISILDLLFLLAIYLANMFLEWLICRRYKIDGSIARTCFEVYSYVLFLWMINGHFDQVPRYGVKYTRSEIANGVVQGRDLFQGTKLACSCIFKSHPVEQKQIALTVLMVTYQPYHQIVAHSKHKPQHSWLRSFQVGARHGIFRVGTCQIPTSVLFFSSLDFRVLPLFAVEVFNCLEPKIGFAGCLIVVQYFLCFLAGFRICSGHLYKAMALSRKDP